MNLNYHIGHLTDHFYTNQKRGKISFHLDSILRKFDEGELKMDKANAKTFKKIVFRMRKFNEGTWEKENWEYKILYYSLIGIINASN